MKNRNIIRIKNDLPELLAAVCNHEDCSDGLKNAIWDAVNENNQRVSFSLEYFRFVLANAETYEQGKLKRMEVQDNETNHAN